MRITYPGVGDRRPDPPHLAAARGDRRRRARHRVPRQPAPRRLDDPAARRPRGGRRRQLGAGTCRCAPRCPRVRPRCTVLAESFNATAARLEQLVGAQRGFVADASHQLRTPLAACGCGSRTSRPTCDGAAAEDLEGALAEVSRLSRLVDGLLVLVRAEQSTSAPAPIAVDEVLDGRCDAWDAFAAEKHVHIDTVGGGRAGRRRDAGPPRAGRRQPAEQRARGRARRERGARRRRGARRLGRAAGQRRRARA